MNFQPEPVLLLATKEQTLVALTDTAWTKAEYPGPYRVKSQWLCDELDAREKATGFQYNAEFQRYIEAQCGLAPSPESGSPLSLLIYNAQAYRRSDRLRREGYAPLTQDMADAAMNRKAKIQVYGSSLLGMPATGLFNPRRIQGRVYLMPPRSRTRCIRIEGQPAKIVDAAA